VKQARFGQKLFVTHALVSLHVFWMVIGYTFY